MLAYLKVYLLYPYLEKYLKREIRSKLKLLKRDYGLTDEERYHRKVKQLHNILSLAYHSVPYYQDLFKSIKFNPDLILKDINYLKKIPYLTKNIIIEQGTRLFNKNTFDVTQHQRKTGGSTGASTFIYYSQSALDWTSAANLFALSHYARRKHIWKEVHFSTEFEEPLSFKEDMKERIKCMAMNRTNIKIDKINDLQMKKVWSKLKKIRPYIIQAHPSTIYYLALYVERNNLCTKGIIDAFESTGETLDNKKKNVIEKNLGCKVYNRYGNAEFGVVAHSHDDINELEIIDYIVHAENHHLFDNVNEIVLTGLTNDKMPLIRYRTGDVGLINVKDNKQYIKNLQGRIHDIVTINNKHYFTHTIQDIFDRIGHIDEFQIVERKQGPPLIKIVTPDKDLHQAITNKVFDILGDGVQVEFTDFSGLIRLGWRDKFRYTVTEP